MPYTTRLDMYSRTLAQETTTALSSLGACESTTLTQPQPAHIGNRTNDTCRMRKTPTPSDQQSRTYIMWRDCTTRTSIS